MIKNIVLDFGHGGLNKFGQYTTAPNKMHTYPCGEVAYEGVLNREIGARLHKKLDNTNLNVVATVDADDSRDKSLSYRVRVANTYNPKETIFISIHSNAFNGDVRGFEIYTTVGTTESDKVAENVYNEVSELYSELKLRLRHDFSDGDPDKEVDFYVLRKTKCPAVLIECLFFDNWEDFKFLKDKCFQEKLANAIYKGIINYVDNSNNI